MNRLMALSSPPYITNPDPGERALRGKKARTVAPLQDTNGTSRPSSVATAGICVKKLRPAIFPNGPFVIRFDEELTTLAAEFRQSAGPRLADVPSAARSEFAATWFSTFGLISRITQPPLATNS